MSDHMILSIVLLAGKSGAPKFDFSFQQKLLSERLTLLSLLVFCCFDQAHFVDLNSRTIKMTSISKLGRPYENGKALDVSTRRLVITDLIDGMSAKAVGKKYKLGTKVVTKTKYRYEQAGTVFPTNRKFTTRNPKKLDKNDIDFIRHLKQVKPSISYNEICNQVTQFCLLPAGTSRSAIGRAIRDDLQMTYKRLTKAKAEKFTPQNIAYCQAFLDYMATVPKHKVKFFD